MHGSGGNKPQNDFSVPSAISHYRQQITDYRKQTNAKRALLIFITTGQVVDVT
ncbi:hypothetical protein H8A97_03590 [Bradyrhizobium sp. Arg62]|uniref:hypothetical protein n=1 Tax=Bradyrhizobium brasilense TaxID=1419277 RepID=UPI001E2BD28C|nr:hypothetical protein [Bradyrhizobium brasilense]MCC8944206.1 hypothetical protein [Bradyrhizobium brasilense]